jgi:hypothetical protein
MKNQKFGLERKAHEISIKVTVNLKNAQPEYPRCIIPREILLSEEVFDGTGSGS